MEELQEKTPPLEAAEVAVSKVEKVGRVKKYFSQYRKKDYFAFLWLLPGFALLLVFSYYPPASALYYSMTDWNSSKASFIGFENFINLFKDKIFGKSLLNVTIMTSIGIVVGNIATILLAELLFNLRSKKISSVLRFLFVLPCLVPGIVNMLLWAKIIFAPNAVGLANNILLNIGIIKDPLGWYYTEATVILSLILTNFPWVAGTSFLIYLAGLQNIPDSVLEASSLDGITMSKRILYIDFPFMLSQIKYFLILGVIGGLQNYGMQLLFTKGGPNYSSMVPGYFIYWNAFNNMKFGYASAAGLIMFAILLTFTIVTNKLMKSSEEAM